MNIFKASEIFRIEKWSQRLLDINKGVLVKYFEMLHEENIKLLMSSTIGISNEKA